jgi:hypothetical protein
LARGRDFALHTVLVESVAWISELKNTLSGALCAGSALLYLKYDRKRKRSAYFIAFALFLAGVMTKTVIVTLPAVLLVIFWWKRGTLSWKRDFAPLIPFFVVGLVAGLVTVWVEQKFCAENGETFDFSLLERFLIAGRLFWFYLGELLWPRDLIMIYPTWSVGQAVWWQYLFPVGVQILFLWLWIIRKKSRGPLAAAICFLLMLFPVLGFFNLSYFMSGLGPARHDAILRADHFQYLATIAIIAPISTGVAWLAAQIKASVRPAVYAAFDSVTSFACQPDMGEAAASYQRALTLQPDFPDAHCNLANLLLEKGELDAALAHYRTALALQPNNPGAHYNLAVGLVRKGELEPAIAELRIALRIDPAYPDAEPLLRDLLARKTQP